MKALAQYIAQYNLYQKFSKNPKPININSISREDANMLFDNIENDLSPENLTCDGELPHNAVVKRAKLLKGAYNDLSKMYTPPEL